MKYRKKFIFNKTRILSRFAIIAFSIFLFCCCDKSGVKIYQGQFFQKNQNRFYYLEIM